MDRFHTTLFVVGCILLAATFGLWTWALIYDIFYGALTANQGATIYFLGFLWCLTAFALMVSGKKGWGGR